MADIRLINILPPQTVQSVQTVTTGAGSQAAATPSSLPPGTVLSGFIVNRDAGGNPVLRTDNGDITFSSGFFLKIGSEVTIRIENNPTGTLAHILSVDGQPPEIAEGQSAFGQAPEIIVSDHLMPQPPVATQAVLLPPAISVTGTLISPQPQGLSTSALAAGTQIKLNIAGLTAAASSVPEEILNVAAAPQAPAGTTTAFYSAYARASASAPNAAAPETTVVSPPQAAISAPAINANTTIDSLSAQPIPAAATVAAPQPTVQSLQITPEEIVQLPTAVPLPILTAVQSNASALPVSAINVASALAVAAVPSASPSEMLQAAITPADPPVQNLAQGQSVTATVIGSEPTGEALLQTPVGIVRLQAGVTLPQGSTVTLEVVQVSPPTLAAAQVATPLPAAPLTELARQWTSLQQIFKLIAGQDTLLPGSFTPPPMASIAVANLQAAATSAPNISSGLLLFISALRGGDFDGWLGQRNVQWLKDQGQDALLRKASSEFSVLSRQFNAPEPQHWQPLFFPVAVDGELQQARLFVKRDRKQSGNQQGKRNEDTRFVLEIDLSQLGEMQMDGFVRRQEKDVHFDLVIRSLLPIPQEMQQDILRIYNETGQLTGYKGSVAFQPVREFPVHPMEEIVARAMGSVVA